MSQLRQLFMHANHRVRAEMSAFLAEQVNWSSKAKKEHIQLAMDELEQFDDDVQPLTSYYASSLTLGHPNQGDVVTAMVAVPLIGVASAMHKMISHSGNQVPSEIKHATFAQNHATPQLHKIPPRYDIVLQQTVSQQMVAIKGVHTTINRDIQQTISKIRDVCKKASTDTDAKHDYAKDVDRIMIGKNGKGGASALAQTIMRTETCRQLNGSTIADYKARGTKRYRFLSLEASNTCDECAPMDGNTYEVEDAEEGVNLPPIHPNCQCWIEPVEDADIDDVTSLEDMMNDPEDFE